MDTIYPFGIILMTFALNSWSFASFVFILTLQLLWCGNLYANGCYTSIINFGDSVSDTGNFTQLASIFHINDIAGFQTPYRETFFHHPTGRASNGRLIIDFLAESLGLPFLPPFLQDKESDNVVALGQGVNYAVVAATALDPSFFVARGITIPELSIGLELQLEWFKQSLPSICSNVSDCTNLVGRSLILMGAIGGGDYNNAIIQGISITEVETYIPFVIDIIISTVTELINMGAQTLVVPGNFPIGCSSSYLTVRCSETEEYDNTTGCLIRLNKIAEYHNQLLQTKLNYLRQIYPTVVIIYADYYNAAMQIFRSPDEFGFTDGALKSCCGVGGPYNFNLSAVCGTVSATVCNDPDTYVDWDGMHYTEAAYRIIFKSLFQGPYTTPQFSLLCPISTS